MKIDLTLINIAEAVNNGWSVQFWPNTERESGGITFQKPGELTIWVEDADWQDDIPKAWHSAYRKFWEYVNGVGDDD